MIGFFKHHMADINGIEIYPVIAFIIFFTAFLWVVVRTYRSNEAEIQHASNLPLEGDQTQIP